MISLINLIHRKILDLRSIERMLLGIASNDPVLIEAINTVNKEAVLAWVKNQQDLDEKTVKELRILARDFAIPGYQSLAKSTLIFLILEKRNAKTDRIAQGNETDLPVSSNR